MESTLIVLTNLKKTYNCVLIDSCLYHCLAVHTIAHLLNVEWFIGCRHGLYGPLAGNLSMLEDETEDNTTYLNPIQSDSMVNLYIGNVKF